jgi:formylglycine-generating enzyme required for sulfatase activity
MRALAVERVKKSVVAPIVVSGLLAAMSLGAAPSPATAKKPTAPKGCPAGMAPIPSDVGGFCIDRFEGSLVDVLAAGKTKTHPFYEPVAGKKVKAVSKKGARPQGYISQVEAKAACEAAGKRLCSNEEWSRACMGKKPTKYPYGDAEVPGRCNGDGTRLHPIAELFGSGTAPFGDTKKMNDPRINQLPGTIEKSGAKSKCTNSYGVFDMVGNLHEWTDDPNGTFKGGYYMDTHRNGDGCSYTTVAHGTSYHDYSTGFRCCK